MTMPQISQAAVDLIVSAEVSSRAIYERKYRRPEWPGGRSGVTVAIGYDLGFATVAKVRADWSGKLPKHMIDAMVDCCGVTGDAARDLTARVRDKIDIPWDQAIAVFMRLDMPDWIARVCNAIPGADKLSPDCLGALTSLAYNRGASFNNSGERYAEMRDIKAHVMSGRLDLVDDDILAMKRLWPDMRGLQLRREAEAKLWERGLDPARASGPAIDAPSHPEPIGPPPKPGLPENGSAGGVVAGGGEVIRQGAESGWSASKIAIAIVIFVGLAAITWLMVREARKSQPIVAREKD